MIVIIFLVVLYVVHWATWFFSFLSSSFSSSSSSSSLLLLLLLPPPPRHYRSFVRDLFFFLSFSNHRGRRMMDIKSPSDSPNPYGSPASEPTSRLVRRQCGGQLTAFPVVFTVDSRHGFHLFLKETPGRDIDASFSLLSPIQVFLLLVVRGCQDVQCGDRAACPHSIRTH